MIYQTSYIPPDNIVHSAGEHLSVLCGSLRLCAHHSFECIEIEVQVSRKDAKDRKER